MCVMKEPGELRLGGKPSDRQPSGAPLPCLLCRLEQSARAQGAHPLGLGLSFLSLLRCQILGTVPQRGFISCVFGSQEKRSRVGAARSQLHE